MATRNSKNTSSSKALANWDDELAKYAAEYGSKEPEGSGSYISTRGGEFSYKGDAIGEVIRVIVLDYAFDNAYYDRPFDPDNITTPDCFSISLSSDDMVPHPDAKDPQCDDCDSCWANKFKSDARQKGKACKNQRRLMVVSAENEIIEDISESSDVAFIRIAPTSLKYFSGFIKKVTKVLGLPPFAVAVDLEIIEEGDAFTVQPNLETIERVPDAIGGALMALRESHTDELLAAYMESEADGDDKPQRQQSRRPASKSASRKPAASKKSAPPPKKKAAAKRSTSAANTKAKDTGGNKAGSGARRPVRRSKF